jgi:hypothetical protein
MIIIMVYGATLVLADAGDLDPEQFIGYLMIFYLIIAPSKSFSTAMYNVQKGLPQSTGSRKSLRLSTLSATSRVPDL